MIDTRLYTFLTLIEEKNYTRTAKKLYITQPAVTHHIKSLEKEHYITIFKSTKTFELTIAGYLLKEYAETAISQYKHFENRLINRDEKVVSNIAITPMVSTCIKNTEFKEFFTQNSIKFNIYAHSYNKIVESLLEGTIDFAIVDNSFDSSLFHSKNLCTENIILICKPNGKYANKERVTREQLLSSILVMSDKGSGLYNTSMLALKNKNLNTKNTVIISSNIVDWIVQEVLSNDGIGFVYLNSVIDYLEKGIVKRIDLLNFQASQNFYLLYNRTGFLPEEVIEMIKDLESTLGD